MIKKLLSLAAVAVAAIALQAPAPKPIPPFEGDGNSQHDGQPAFCVNSDHTGWKHNCTCKGMIEPGQDRDKMCEGMLPGEGGGESAKCSVYCRKTACRCVDPCTT